MKKLFLLFFLLFTSCTTPLLETAPKFRFGQKVFVSEGFYKGCTGNVIKYRRGFESIEIYYDVDATCSSVDGKFSHRETMVFEERTLIEDVSE